MENNLDNKLKFMLHYYGQSVFVVDGLEKIKSEPHLPICNADYIQLRSLASITDEEAIEVAKIFGIVGNITIRRHNEHVDVISGETYLQIWFDGDFRTNVSLISREWFRAYQKLQSFNIALPFHDLSVKQQIAYGWVKLTNLKGE